MRPADHFRLIYNWAVWSGIFCASLLQPLVRHWRTGIMISAPPMLPGLADIKEQQQKRQNIFF